MKKRISAPDPSPRDGVHPGGFTQRCALNAIESAFRALTGHQLHPRAFADVEKNELIWVSQEVPMATEFVLLQLPDDSYLSSDFETWTTDTRFAHRFIRGAALNSCVERWRRDGARTIGEPDR